MPSEVKAMQEQREIICNRALYINIVIHLTTYCTVSELFIHPFLNNKQIPTVQRNMRQHVLVSSEMTERKMNHSVHANARHIL